MQAINAFAKSSNVKSLAALEQALFRPDKPLTAEHRQKMLAAAAEQMAESAQSLEELQEQDQRWNALAPRLEQQWPLAPYEVKSLLREMVIEIDKTQSLIDRLPAKDYEDLVAAMAPKKREAFIFGRALNKRMADALRPLVREDTDLAGKPTSMQVWDTVKQLFPHFEEALSKPLDRSKYVDADLGKVPRRHTS